MVKLVEKLLDFVARLGVFLVGLTMLLTAGFITHNWTTLDFGGNQAAVPLAGVAIIWLILEFFAVLVLSVLGSMVIYFSLTGENND